MPQFSETSKAARGRTGTITFEGDWHGISDVPTPYLFPVTYLMTGTTARGGGMWKYILHANEDLSLMRRNQPILSQVLHFLDYGVSPRGVQKWREHSIRTLYNTEVSPALQFHAPIFLDSGGFKLMWKNLDLSRYGIMLERDIEAESIAEFQLALGGNIIASLDYPLPPKLNLPEAEERMKRSRRNAILVAKYLRDRRRENAPFLYMAIHGLTDESIAGYVKKLFEDIEQEGLEHYPFGLAIGSLVPLRQSTKSHSLVHLVSSAIGAIPGKYRSRVPIHIFGVTGVLTPFLAYCGVDTFDSSTYAQEARGLSYLEPVSLRYKPFLEMKPSDLICQCSVCRRMHLQEAQEALVTQSNFKPLRNGHFKSKYYADIALHNLEMDHRILSACREAIEADDLRNHVVELARTYPRLDAIASAIAQGDQQLQRKLSARVRPATRPPVHTEPQVGRSVSLSHTPADFDIARDGNRLAFSGSKRMLLVIPCSEDKPYSASRTHRFISGHLAEVFPDWEQRVHKVTLSGLYGPVPVEYENDEPVLGYDFRLQAEDAAQIRLCADRLKDFLATYGSNYSRCIAYGTSRAYRAVFAEAQKGYRDLIVLPVRPKALKLTEFFRAANVQELINLIRETSGDVRNAPSPSGEHK